MSERRLRLAPWLLGAAVVVALDQGTKQALSAALGYAQPNPIIPGYFYLTLLHNTGAAFSLLADAPGWQRWFFAGVAVVVVGWILVSLRRLPADSRWSAASLTLIMAGALGNCWDRIVHGHVIDFVQLCYEQACFPAFNLADSAITVGAAMVLVDMLRELRR